MKFTAIDFETANRRHSSVCAVGLSLVDGGEIVGRAYQLIRPVPLCFDRINLSKHGITEDAVADAPSFAEYGPTLLKAISGPLVAHNASFDMSVLRHALDALGITCPDIDYFCTYEIARLTWPEYPKHNLKDVAKSLGISFQHHHAGEDARACALIALEACRVHGAESLYDLQELCGLCVGSLSADGYVPCGRPLCERAPATRPTRLRAADVSPTSSELDPEHPFFGKSFAFTAEMTTMSRKDAMQAVVNRGGTCHDSVRRDTNYLVLGHGGFIGCPSGHMSFKMKKAEDMSRKGLPIEFLSEAAFVRMM